MLSLALLSLAALAIASRLFEAPAGRATWLGIAVAMLSFVTAYGLVFSRYTRGIAVATLYLN
ncbi:MAG: hypothetical protein ACRBCT_00645 [Alphaproteobacteria bacterium]